MRRKKALAGIMAGVMILGSMNLAFAATTTESIADVDSSGFWKAFSEGIELEEGSNVTITYTSTTYADADEVASDGSSILYKVPYYVLYTADVAAVNGSGYAEYYVCRADVYGWPGTSAEDGSYVLSIMNTPDWDTWIAECKAGIDCTIYASYEDGVVTVEYTAGSAASTLTMDVDTESPLYISLGAEECVLTDISVTIDDGAVEDADVPEDAASLALDETVSITITDGARQYYCYTPSETDYYQFCSSNNSYTGDDGETCYYDPMVYLYVLNNGSLSCISYDDDGSDNRNFSLNYQLEAGKTYYYEIFSYSGDYVVFDATLTKYDPMEESDVRALTADDADEDTLAADSTVYYSYTPTDTGYYQFTVDSVIPEVSLLVLGEDGSTEVIAYANSYYTDGEEGNYSKIVKQLEAGKTYYFMVENSEADDIVIIPSLTSLDVDDDQLIDSVTFTLNQTTFDSMDDVVYDGTVTVIYKDGSTYSFTLDGVDSFTETDDYGNTISNGYMSWDSYAEVTADGLAYSVDVYLAVSDAIEDMDSDPTEIYVLAEDVTVIEDLDTGYDVDVDEGSAYIYYSYTPEYDGEYYFITGVSSNVTSEGEEEYSLSNVRYYNSAKGELKVAGKTGENGYKVYTLKAGVTYYITTSYEAYDESIDEIAATVSLTAGASSISTSNSSGDNESESNTGNTESTGNTENTNGTDNTESTEDTDNTESTEGTNGTNGTDSTGGTSVKSTGDVAGRTAAGLLVLAAGVAGVLLIRRRSLSGVDQ